MNVADKDLCKTLWELSRWEGCENDGKNYDVNIGFYPAYDLDYLLRKLPLERQTEFGTDVTLHLYFDSGKTSRGWVAEYTDGNYIVLEAGLSGEASFAEDAACKLAIELFKQGVLKS